MSRTRELLLAGGMVAMAGIVVVASGIGQGTASRPARDATPVHTPRQAAAPSPGSPLTVEANSAVTSSSGIVFSFASPTHRPVVNRRWTMSATAIRGASGLAGRVRVDVMFAGKVVGHIHSGRVVRGRYRHSLRWPSRSIGYALTLRASVSAAGRTQRFLYPVEVRAG